MQGAGHRVLSKGVHSQLTSVCSEHWRDTLNVRSLPALRRLLFDKVDGGRPSQSAISTNAHAETLCLFFIRAGGCDVTPDPQSILRVLVFAKLDGTSLKYQTPNVFASSLLLSSLELSDTQSL